MQVIVDGLAVNYQKVGKGKTIVFIHGWADSQKTFAPLIADLKHSYGCVSLDLPGFGGSQRPNTAWGLDEYAEFVTKFLHKLQIKNPTALLGHSNGGAIAIRAVSAKQLAPKKLILVASAGVRNEKAVYKKALALLAKTGRFALWVIPKTNRQSIRAKFYKKIGSDFLVSEHMQDTFKRIVKDDITIEASAVNCPTLIIYGIEDRATPPRYGTILASRILKSSLNIVDSAGHFVHQERANIVSNMIKEFMVKS